MASKRWGDPGDLTRSWRNDPGPAFMPSVKQLNGLAATRSRQREWTAGPTATTRGLSLWARRPIMTSRLSFSDHEVSEICRLIRSAFCPKDEQLASVLSGVRAVFPACLEVQRSACLVLASLVKSPSTTYSASAVPLWRCARIRARLHVDVQHQRFPACNSRCGPPA